MEVFQTSSEMTAWSNQRLSMAKTIALVPTMGCLHAGHLALVRTAARHADLVVTSLFVNPLQFGPSEDYDLYPRTLAEDLEAASQAGAAVLFAPLASDLYPELFQTTVTVKGLTAGLCGASRPGHFDGVTTVVAKLFHIVKPTVAVFGQKDLQQLAVIRAMVRDLNWDLEIIGHPIVRETDGLALSSRNRYLRADERRQATCLWQALQEARKAVAAGERQSGMVLERTLRSLSSVPGLAIDYLKIVEARTLAEQATIDENSVLAMAIRLGNTRLIDNGYLIADEYKVE